MGAQSTIHTSQSLKGRFMQPSNEKVIDVHAMARDFFPDDLTDDELDDVCALLSTHSELDKQLFNVWVEKGDGGGMGAVVNFGGVHYMGLMAYMPEYETLMVASAKVENVRDRKFETVAIWRRHPDGSFEEIEFQTVRKH